MNRLKTAFDGIRADDVLKAGTLAFLQSKTASTARRAHRLRHTRLAAALACFCAVALLGTLSYSAYFTEALFVDVDINPSIEMAVNRFGRVIGVSAYNPDGEALLAQLRLTHQPYEHAIRALTDAAIQNGFLSDGGLVSVTVQGNDAEGRNTLITSLETSIQSTMQRRHCAARVDVFSVDNATRITAHAFNLSPAKYLAILALQEVDPTATMDRCRKHSIGEIHALTRRHGGYSDPGAPRGMGRGHRQGQE